MDFWDNVKSELSYESLTQKDLANKAQLNYRTLQNWIARNIQPDIIDAIKIARALGVPVEYLVTGSEPHEISDEEIALVVKFRHLSQNNKDLVKGLVTALENTKNT